MFNNTKLASNPPEGHSDRFGRLFLMTTRLEGQLEVVQPLVSVSVRPPPFNGCLAEAEVDPSHSLLS